MYRCKSWFGFYQIFLSAHGAASPPRGEGPLCDLAVASAQTRMTGLRPLCGRAVDRCSQAASAAHAVCAGQLWASARVYAPCAAQSTALWWSSWSHWSGWSHWLDWQAFHYAVVMQNQVKAAF